MPFEVSGKLSDETINNSSLALIEGGPHGLTATHPEEFNRALLDVLPDWIFPTTFVVQRAIATAVWAPFWTEPDY